MIFHDATFSLTVKIYLSEKVENYYHQVSKNSQDITSTLIGQKKKQSLIAPVNLWKIEVYIMLLK